MSSTYVSSGVIGENFKQKSFVVLRLALLQVHFSLCVDANYSLLTSFLYPICFGE
jgi:hypothetical protein